MNQIFKLNQSSTGSALFYKMGKNNGGDNIIYMQLVRQVNWNSSTRTGSVSENMKKPGQNISIALTLNDASQYIGVIENKSKYSTVHKNGDVMKSISFSYLPPKEEGKEGAFAFNVSSGQNKFSIMLTEAEARVFKVYLDEVLRHTARENIKDVLAQIKAKN